MKRLLLLLPLMFVGAKVSSDQLIKPAKEELNIIQNVEHPLVRASQFDIPMACLQKNKDEDNEVSGYTHCRTCSYGVFLEHDGVKKCTYCGIKEHYEPR